MNEPARFFLWVFGLSAPIWILGALVGEIPTDLLPINLPFGALMTFVPMIAAVIMIGARNGAGSVRRFLLRAVDVRGARGARWSIVAAVFMPAALVLQYFLLRASGVALPEPSIPLGAALAFLAMFLVGAAGEELGWQGFVYPLLRERWNALEVSLVIGAVWAVWHVVPLVQAGRSGEWILWQCLAMFALRVITTWLFVNAGESVFVALLFHAMGNVAQFLFPNFGSHYDPLAMFMILTVAAIVITAVWGAQNLSTTAKRL